jgi:hypothetical protein
LRTGELGNQVVGGVIGGVVYVGGGGSTWYALDAQLGTSCRVSQPGTTLQDYNWSSSLIYNGDALIGIASNGDNSLVQGQLLEVQPDLIPDHRHL